MLRRILRYYPAMPLDQPDDKHNPDEFRMTLGEHLDELRGCLIRSLLALVIGAAVCIWPARFLLKLIVRPLIVVQGEDFQPQSLQALSPTEPFMIYVKVVLICGLILASPVVIYQLWSFVAKGLYRREQKVVLRLAPASVGLFFVGVTFMYLFVLPVCLRFLIGFASWLPAPDPTPNALDRLLTGNFSGVAASQATSQPTSRLPVLTVDPATPQTGEAWINATQHRLKFQGVEQIYSLDLQPDEKRGLVMTHFRLSEYLTFFILLTLAFGGAFQLPLVVIFLVRSGIMPARTLRGYRKVVIAAIVIIAGIIAPPDLMSHLLLSGPMILLFELGLFIADRKPSATSGPMSQ